MIRPVAYGILILLLVFNVWWVLRKPAYTGDIERTKTGFNLLAIDNNDQPGASSSAESKNLEEVDFFGSSSLPDENQQGIANLEGADLDKSNFAGIFLLWANLKEASLKEANLQGAYLSWANLSKSVLTGANLERANLQGSNLEAANLADANLKKANLKGSSLIWTNLRRADLSGADLTGTFLKWTSVTGAKYDNSTKFPEGFDPKQYGMIESDK